MRTEHLGSIPLSILLLTSLITSLISITIFSVGAVEAASVTIETVGQWETLENAPEPVGQFNGHRIEAMGNYIYFWVANSTGFYRYNPSAGSWETLTSAPTSSSYGTGIVRTKDTAGNPAIYIIAGTTSANSQKWYRYTDAGGWSGMLSTSIPWTGSGAQANCNKPANGSEFVWDGEDTIYYFPGSGYSYNRYDWYKYTISTNTWTYMGEFNTSGDPKNGPGNSACFVTYGGENYIFIQFGHTPGDDYKPAKFMRYQISIDNWWTPAQTGYGADDGADLVWDGGDDLYVFPGAYEEGGLINEYRFLVYSIPQNQWTSLPDFPSPKGQGNGSDDGGAAGIVGSYIYYLKGGDGNGSTLASNFYRYQIAPATPTAWATGPKGSTKNPSVSITYNYTHTPTSVKLYYTKDGGTSWTLAGEDTSVDGTFAYNITSGDGTYGWIAVAIGGGSTENDPPAGGTPPEAAPLILDTTPTLIAPANDSWTNDNTPTFEWGSVISPDNATYQIQIDDNPDLISPVYFAVGLVENNHTLPDENALAPGTYFWRVRAVDNAENAGNWSTVWTLFIIAGNRWEQTNWDGGPTKPSLQVGTWDNTYDNFYDNDNVNWLASVRLDNYMELRAIDHVVISEFSTRGSSSAYDEFVELYNPTSSAIDIGGWIFEYWNGTAWVYYSFSSYVAVGTIPSGATIPAHGFYLWGNNRGYVSPESGPTPDWNTYGGGLSDGPVGSPRGIRLKMPDNVTVIDTVVYEGDGNTSNAEAEGGLTATNAATPPNSVERKAQSTSTASSMEPGGVDENSGNAYDSNNNYNDWVRRSSRNPQNSSSTLENPIPSYYFVSQFRSAGWFESSIYGAVGIADWKIISWIENKPSGTSIIVEARTGNDNNPYDGGWSGWYQHDNGAENALMENGRYVQYRVELSTTDSAKTPKLSQITLDDLAHVTVVREVDVTISPSAQEGLLNENLVYDVVVTNLGNVPDDYNLDLTEALGWPHGWDPVENLRPTDDAQVRESNPTTNYGNQYNMYVGMEDPENAERSYLKFDLASIPIKSMITSATLSLMTRYGPSHPPSYTDDNIWIQAMSVSDDSWTELGINWTNAPAPGAMLDNVYVISDSWVPQYTRWYWDVTSFVAGEFAGDKVASFCMMSQDEEDMPESNTVWFYQKDDYSDGYWSWLEVIWEPKQTGEIAPGDNWTGCIWVEVSGSPCTTDTLTVTATSIGDPMFSDSDNCTAHSAVCGVEVIIENKLLEGLPCEWLEFTISVHNSGAATDNIILSYIPDGWPDISIDPLVLIDVMPSEHRQATMFVHVPDNAIGCTYKDITVVAESQFCGATDNDTAQAHVIEKPSPVRGPILIVGNDNFIPEKGVNGGGSGTELDPYIIENWIISAENAHGIAIEDTTAYFVVRNCVVENGDIGWPTPSYYGIRLENVTNGRIENNISENNNYGIVLYANSRNNVVDNNTFENYAWYGVRLEMSHNNLISNNFFNCTQPPTTSATWAIGLWRADNNNFENNTVENRGGIYLYETKNIRMRNNTHSSISSGFGVEGVTLEDFVHDIDNSNLVNGKPILYLIGHSNEVISPSQEVGYLGLVNCDNIRVENLVFARRENTQNLQGILMANTQNSRVENCAFENNSKGIYLWGSNNNILTHNSVDNNLYGILILYSSDNNIIEYNTITNTREPQGYAIHFYQTGAGSNNIIRNNDITLNYRGIYFNNSDNNRIYHNNIINNTLYQAYDNGSNYWDDGYPSGGNYWSDYTGEDNYQGENQDIAGSDGIGDTPYYITGDNNQDRYPLMSPIGIPWTGTAVISLVNLYTVNVEKILDLNQGSKLVVKFYTYGDAYENENVIETFAPPAHVEENELARHPGPGRVGVKNAKLDLTTDDTGNVISTIESFTVTKTMLELRFTDIPLEWALAGTPEEKTALEIEYMEVPMQWALAPS